MKAYLEKINGDWLDDFVYMSKYPLQDMGFEIIAFDGDDMQRTLFDKNEVTKDDVMIGSVQVTTKFFEALGIATPEYIGYPDSLHLYYGRKIEECRLGDINRPYPYFIKPSKEVKLFTGDIIESEKSMEILKTYCGDGITDDTMVYVQPKIEIEAEYRCFVFERQLKGIQYYTGDFKVFPNAMIIEDMIENYTDCPIAYTLDVGVRGSATDLIEINDMWAIGSYGFDAKTYALMCVRRQREIVKG